MPSESHTGKIPAPAPAPRLRLTDAYVLQYLIQRTNDVAAPLHWRESSQALCEASSDDVRIELDLLEARAGSRVVLTLYHGEDRTEITEPASISFFGRKYRTEEEREVADFLRSLAAMARRQIVARKKAAAGLRGVQRQSIYQRLLFGAGSEPRH